MMAKAHIAIGMAAAYSIIGPDTLQEAMPVVAGSAIGCLICDLDCENKTEKADSSFWRIATTVIAVVTILEDYLLGGGMVEGLINSGNYIWCIGIAGFILTCTFASISTHRGFSHSLLALALESAFIWLVFPTMTVPFAIAFMSHVLLDLTNKKSVRLLYPAKKGLCLGWFYADRRANRVCELVGSVWLISIALATLFG